MQQDSKKVYFHEGQIWWAALGKNVGFEMDGKHATFERPVFILKKYNEEMCFVLPLTTHVKQPLPWYQVPIVAGGKSGALNITQGRTISSRRLLRKEDSVGKEEVLKISMIFSQQFEKK